MRLCMGNSNNKTFFYTLIATFVGVLILTLSISQRKGNSSLFGLFKGANTGSFFSAQHMPVPKNKYSVTRYDKTNGHSNEDSIYKNDYEASTSYAESYTEPQEVNHPLIGSAKFLGKKKDLKKAKKRKSKLLAKNKKKKDAKDSGDDDDFFEDDELESSLNSSAQNSAIGASGGARPANTKKTPEEEEKDLNTVEFWDQPIFIEEDFNAVVKLIESYQIKKVSNTVFYTVVDDMTHDERPNLREYGFLALSATPSTKSFSQLTWMKHNDTVSDLRNSAKKEINNYADAVRLGHIVGALKMDSSTSQKTTLEALSVVTATTKKYSGLRANHEQSPSTRPSTSQLSLLEPRLASALNVIQERLVNSTDPLIQSEATKTVAAINLYTGL
jgi:hypothetical protein